MMIDVGWGVQTGIHRYARRGRPVYRTSIYYINNVGFVWAKKEHPLVFY